MVFFFDKNISNYGVTLAAVNISSAAACEFSATPGSTENKKKRKY